MSILFTKKISPKEVSDVLGDRLSVDFLEVLEFHLIDFQIDQWQAKNLIFTSVNGVKGFLSKISPKDIQKESKIYAVGNKTQQELENHGFLVEIAEKNALELSRFLIENQIQNLIHFCGNRVLPTLENELKKAHISYKKIEVYHSELLYPICSKKYKALVFFSPSGVESYIKNNPFRDEVLFSIGQTTAQALKNYTEKTIFTSEKENTQDLLELIKKEMQGHAL